MKYKIYVDLDGVLADFVARVHHVIHIVYGDSVRYNSDLYEVSSNHRKQMWEAVRVYQEEHGGELWSELSLMRDANDLWNYVSRVDGTEILTATGKPTYRAAEQKHKWVRSHLGENVTVNTVRKANEKAKYADTHHILIDDSAKAIDPWIEAGGIGILHTSAASTISKLKELGI